MIPVNCRELHKPPVSYGDCLKACIASMLEIDPDRNYVPHFFYDNPPVEEALQRLDYFLLEHGYKRVMIPFAGSATIGEILDLMAANAPGVYYMLFGNCASGGHVVIGLNDAVVHNPSWTQDPLVGPNDNGMWIVCVLVSVKQALCQ